MKVEVVDYQSQRVLDKEEQVLAEAALICGRGLSILVAICLFSVRHSPEE